MIDHAQPSERHVDAAAERQPPLVVGSGSRREIECTIEHSGHGRHRHHGGLTRRQLDAEREPVDTAHDVDEIRAELVDRYGTPPDVVESLLVVPRLRARARAAGLTDIVVMGKNIRFFPVKELPDSRVVRLNRMYPKSRLHSQNDALMVPRPLGSAKGTGVVLLEWARGVIDHIIDPPATQTPPPEAPSR